MFLCVLLIAGCSQSVLSTGANEQSSSSGYIDQIAENIHDLFDHMIEGNDELPDIDFARGEDEQLLKYLEMETDMDNTMHPLTESQLAGSKSFKACATLPCLAANHPFTANNDLVERHEIGKAPSEFEKVKRLATMISDIEGGLDVRPLTFGAQTYVDKFAGPVVNCLRYHYNDDLNIFVEHNAGRISYGMFCCRGEPNRECKMISRSGEFEKRQQLSKIKDPRKLIEQMLELDPLAQPYDTVSKRFNQRSYEFLIKSFIPVMNCLKNHFHGDVDAFLRYHENNIRLSMFRSSNCNGRGESCKCGKSYSRK